MSFIERARDKEVARRVLGVPQSANRLEIQSAWKRRVFDTHPDRNGGESHEFECVRAAYDLLRNEAAHSRNWDGSVATRANVDGMASAAIPRPVPIAKRTQDLTPKVMEECRELLRSNGAASGSSDSTSIVHLDSEIRAMSDETVGEHVPSSVERQGRNLEFIVTTPLRIGPNLVVLPSALLKGKRRSEPKIFTFRSNSVGRGCLVIPDAIVSWAFPGARRIQVRFPMT